MKVFAGLALAFSAVALAISVGVVITELQYVSDHPYRYGPAKVIAWTAGAGGLISLAVGSLAAGLARLSSE